MQLYYSLILSTVLAVSALDRAQPVREFRAVSADSPRKI